MGFRKTPRRKTIFVAVVFGAGFLAWRHGIRSTDGGYESFVPGLTETKIRPDTRDSAVANLDAVQIAEAVPSSATDANPMESEVLWKGVSMFNAMMWGGSIVSSKAGIDALASAGFEEPGVLFGALRFTVATLCLSPWLFSSSSLQSTLGSLKVGAFYGAGYVAMFVALGLGTTAAKTSFFGSLQAVVCAGITCIAAGRLNLGTLAAAAMAVTGVGVLEFAGGGALDLGIGDLVASLVPLSFGAGWYVLGQTMKDHPQDTLPSTAIQLGMTALANIGWLAWQKGGDGAMELGMQLPQVLQAPGLLGPLCFSALVGNVLTMWLANEALRRVKGSDVALIAASEPLWAAVAAMALLGDVLQPHEILGGALLIGAVVCNETLAEETAEGVDAPESEPDLLKRASLSAPYFARMAVHLRRGSKLVLPTAGSTDSGSGAKPSVTGPLAFASSGGDDAQATIADMEDRFKQKAQEIQSGADGIVDQVSDSLKNGFSSAMQSVEKKADSTVAEAESAADNVQQRIKELVKNQQQKEGGNKPSPPASFAEASEKTTSASAFVVPFFLVAGAAGGFYLRKRTSGDDLESVYHMQV
ncbi:mco [Symbiodinium sp. CCMP2456]|nr:mco [Symbiodinium sp. CCMP2456]